MADATSTAVPEGTPPAEVAVEVIEEVLDVTGHGDGTVTETVAGEIIVESDEG